MYRLDREDFLKFPFIFLWALLGFQAGFINAFGFLACGRYVSHVTGVGTQIGLSLGENQAMMALELLAFPVLFMLGAFVNGVFTSARLERGLRPYYDGITASIVFILLAIAVIGHWGGFGVFGTSITDPRDFALLLTLAFVCGMQNSCFATLTKGQIRTTHLTGISTDIGTDFARMFFGKLSSQEADLAGRANFSRIATFMAFSLGSIISVLATKEYEYLSLLVPISSSAVVFTTIITFGTKRIPGFQLKRQTNT